MKNIFSVDLEDWFCSHNLTGTIAIEDWHIMESRVERNVFKLLEVLDKFNTRATFFVLGWIAERYPDLIEAVHRAGHEIASHGYAHQLVYTISSNQFKEDVNRSAQILSSITGSSVIGYRAPAFSVTSTTSWVLTHLQEAGYVYDSSIYPVSYHPDYGMPGVPSTPFIHMNGLIEFPLNTASIGKLSIPCSGGAYLRFLPYGLFKNFVTQVERKHGFFIFYIHPWEIDSQMPKIKLPFTKYLRHYTNLSTTYLKINRLLQDFEFFSMKEGLARLVEDRSLVPYSVYGS